MEKILQDLIEELKQRLDILKTVSLSDTEEAKERRRDMAYKCMSISNAIYAITQ